LASGSADTALTKYEPGDFTDSVKQNKAFKVSPWTAILVQPFVLGDNNGVVTMTISGWMDSAKNAGAGPGLRLYTAVLTAANRVWTSTEKPSSEDGDPWGAGAWRPVDVHSSVVNLSGAFLLATGDIDGVLLLPTLGYSYLLPEFHTFTNTTKVGILWRPVGRGDFFAKTNAYS
jgi:hypothetical protein